MGGALTRMMGFGNMTSSGFATVTIPSGTVGSDLTDFPVCIDLADLSSGFWSAVASDGSDIVVTESDGVTELPRDVAGINVGSQIGRLYFKADLLSGSDNEFHIYYGSGDPGPAATDPTGRNAVWSGFSRVYDGFENQDRTGNVGALTLNGATFNSAGYISLGGANTYGICDAPSWPGTVSFFSIGYRTGSPGNMCMMSYLSSYVTSPTRLVMLLRGTGNTFGTWNNTNGFSVGGSWPSLNTLFSGAVTHSSSGNRISYLDGSQVASAGSSANLTAIGGSAKLMIGAEDASLDEEFPGRIYVALFATSILSANTIAAMHSNWLGGSFYSIS